MKNLPNLIKEAEKEFDVKFLGEPYENTLNSEIPHRDPNENFTVEDIKSFIFHDYTEKIVEGIKEEVRKKKYDLDKVFQSEEAKLEAEGYNEAIDDILSLLSSLTKSEIKCCLKCREDEQHLCNGTCSCHSSLIDKKDDSGLGGIGGYRDDRGGKGGA